MIKNKIKIITKTFLAISLFSSFYGTAQKDGESNIDYIKSSKVHSELVFDAPPSILACDEKSSYLISIDNTAGRVYLMYTVISNETGEIVFNKEIEIDSPDELPSGISSFYDVIPLHNGKTAIIMKHELRKNYATSYWKGIFSLYAKMIDNETGEFDEKVYLISDLSRNNYEEIYNVTIKNSPNRKHLVFHENVSDGEQTKSIFHILDENLNEIEEFEEEGELSRNDLNSIIIDNEGSVYCVSFGKKYPIITSYDAYLGYEKWSEEIELEFSFSGKLSYSNLLVFIDKNGKFTLTGLLEKPSYNSKSKDIFFWDPVFFFTVSINLESKEKQYAEIWEIETKKILFPLMDQKKLKRDLEYNRKKRMKKKGIAYGGMFNSSDFFLKKNGGFYYVVQEYDYTGDFIYGNILIFNVDPDGKVISSNYIRQKQVLNKKGYGSFAGFTMQDDLILLLNMDENNINLSGDDRLKTMSSEKHMVSMQLTLSNTTGEMEIEKLNMLKMNSTAPLAPSSYYQRHYDNEVIILGASKSGRTRYVQLHTIDRALMK